MSQGSTEQLRARDYVQALLARANSRAARAGANPGATFVFRPGGTAGANVYTTWSTVMAARAQVQGLAWILVDDSIVSPAPITAGTWNLDNTILQGIGGEPTEFAQLELEQGAHWTFGFLQVQYLEIQSVSTLPVTTIAAGVVLFFSNQVSMNLSPNVVPFFDVANGAVFAVNQLGGNFGDNTNALIEVEAGGTLVWTGALGADLENHAVGGAGAAGGATYFFTSDCIVHTSTTPGTFTQSSQASAEGYTATTVANWSGTNPTSVANALDRLAAHVGPVP